MSRSFMSVRDYDHGARPPSWWLSANKQEFNASRMVVGVFTCEDCQQTTPRYEEDPEDGDEQEVEWRENHSAVCPARILGSHNR